MYEYINGLVTNIYPAYLVIADRSGVGYKLFVANPYRFEQNVESHVYVEQVVRENELTLYGFIDENEKALFNKLINVSGIGPKSALAILANGDSEGLVNAIANEDPTYLMQFPGVGKKTAQQIVLDLKGKLDDMAVSVGMPASKAKTNQALTDALEALESLGYSAKEVAKLEKQLAANHDTTDGYIRSALKLLVK
ncbi:Holliday junction branch migration protein RuvA [Leuconostoc carnosum]|uniref:Holliday junction branch migration complex subunit RuvA n=2 Tax=Leuconostoc carnosum TaxID=1252 RepID=K0DBU1_LEUCJ|nr:MULTISPECIES: Holliday junction branch migration protein RuvA [Leuconostoc]AFT81426.1 Holliday junction DNA helicase RuvA [Leuconostoc carnosum JB16]KAA8326030.1 Holliday junction branch migration protein RuvA [Leuconostoc carnosum]KAA8330237.1 Holliday junction branch migration protein RuvA [Leuconostoc carnosum]KAA8362313.1 Holliday junction branch migration protein RuvA [Leuconostoc carnosum]KAA8366862.1 Holliday junction branch migration protein RuvA [Leuconostoc carnosum]